MEKNSDPHGDDWQKSGADIVPGRYYDALGFVFVPAMGDFGGDVMMMIWRYEDEPEIWNVTIRYRYYARDNGDPFHDEDRKNWYAWRGNNRTKRDSKQIRSELETISGMASIMQGQIPNQVDWLVLDGDHHKAGDVFANTERPWLHKKTVPLGEPNG